MLQSPFLNVAPIPNTKNGHKQMVLGSEFLEFEPTVKTPTLYEFELTGTEPLAFGIPSGFWVEGSLQKWNETTKTWVKIETDDKNKVLLRQNWFDYLVDRTNVFHANRNINPNDVPSHIDPYINSYAYGMMNKDIKKLLCTHRVCPGNAITHIKGAWSFEQDTWYSYADLAYGQDKIKFRWVPLFQWPFHQASNYMVDPLVASTAVPIQTLGKLHFRIHFNEDPSSIIFKEPRKAAPAAGETPTPPGKYRFNMTKFTMFAEELRVSPNHGRNFLTNKSLLTYPGLTRQAICENIPAGVYSHRSVIPMIEFPEGIMIFCVPKSVISGTLKFKDVDNETVFMPHKIKHAEPLFDGLPFNAKRPGIGQKDNSHIHLVDFRDYMFAPPLGLIHNHDLIEVDSTYETAFPHVFTNFTITGKDSRIQTVHDTTFAANRIADLVINFTFDGAVSGDYSYIIMAYYSDVHLLLQMGNGKNVSKGFMAQWNRVKSIN